MSSRPVDEGPKRILAYHCFLDFFFPADGAVLRLEIAHKKRIFSIPRLMYRDDDHVKAPREAFEVGERFRWSRESSLLEAAVLGFGLFAHKHDPRQSLPSR